MVKDYSSGGLGVQCPDSLQFEEQQAVHIGLSLGRREFSFSAKVINSGRGRIGVAFDELSMEQEKNLIQCTFARADAWLNWNNDRAVDRPLSSLGDIFVIGCRGYKRIIRSFAPALLPLLQRLEKAVSFFLWLLPKSPKAYMEESSVEV